MDTFINLGYSLATRCGECGDMVSLETNGTIMRTELPCQCPPKGPIEFELNVPSGELVYTDDLRSYFNVTEDYDINCRLGLIRQSLAMAAIGCGHGFVGNSCPGVYRLDGNTLVVADVPDDDETGKPVDPPGKHVGSICTDLWWYSFADAREFKRRGGTKKNRVRRLKVRPGVYKFSHNLREDRNYSTTFVYATITWVREPD